MARFTTEVRSICESFSGLEASKGADDVENIITAAAPKIFGTDWPIFDEDYRIVLEKTILRHYYTREISEETVGLWRLRLVDKLNIIMPYYNQLYESEKLIVEPFNDTDYTDTGNRKGSSDSTGKSTSQSSSESTGNRTGTNHQTNDRVSDTSTWQLYSDTPQGGVIGISEATGSVGDNSYLTNAEHDIGNVKDDTTIDGNTSENTNTNASGNSTTDTTGRVSNVEDYTEHIVGKRGTKSYASLLKEFRETFLNINMRIIEDLSDLFFGLWQ